MACVLSVSDQRLVGSWLAKDFGHDNGAFQRRQFIDPLPAGGRWFLCTALPPGAELDYRAERVGGLCRGADSAPGDLDRSWALGGPCHLLRRLRGRCWPGGLTLLRGRYRGVLRRHRPGLRGRFGLWLLAGRLALLLPLPLCGFDPPAQFLEGVGGAGPCLPCRLRTFLPLLLRTFLPLLLLLLLLLRRLVAALLLVLSCERTDDPGDGSHQQYDNYSKRFSYVFKIRHIESLRLLARMRPAAVQFAGAGFCAGPRFICR